MRFLKPLMIVVGVFAAIVAVASLLPHAPPSHVATSGHPALDSLPLASLLFAGTIDVFSTNYLMSVIANLPTPPSFFLDRYFPTQFTDTSEEIHFDVIDANRRLAPFVHPSQPGKIINSAGRSVKTFAPAYIKDKRPFDSTKPFKRAVGERLGGGELTPEQRLSLAIAAELEDQTTMLYRRFEVMAAEAIRTGKVTVVGDAYPSVVVDFGRAAGLTTSLPVDDAGERFDQAGAKPLKKLRALAMLALKTKGAYTTDVIFGVDAWEAFIANTSVEKRWNSVNTNAQGTMKLGDRRNGEGAQYMGTLEGFDLYTYAGWYVDPADGVEKEIMPAKEIVMAAPADVEGVRAFGAIKDLDSLQAVPQFVKSWQDNDPPVRFVMMQSAPLMVPRRPNATINAIVLS